VIAFRVAHVLEISTSVLLKSGQDDLSGAKSCYLHGNRNDAADGRFRGAGLKNQR